jgi:hypothetical protein
MRWNPDDEDGNIDGSDQRNSTPLHPGDCAPMLSDEGDAVDDNLHQ